MKLRILSFSAVLCVSILGIGNQSGLAQPLQPLQPQEPDWLIRMYDDGWQKVQEGVLQRGEGGSQIETFTYGEGGLRWTVARLEEQVSFLTSRYNNHPDPDLAKVLDRLHGEILAANARLDSGQAGEAFNGEQMDDCSIAYGAHAYADPLSGSAGPGVTARADAYWHANCGFVGNAYSYAYVEGATGTVFSTKTQEDPKYNGTWLDTAAQWNLSATSSCYSTAYAHAWSDALNIGYTAQDTNYLCPNPLSVSVRGPTDVYTDYYGTPCATVTWTASISGGTPSYGAINWYIGTTYQGSGSSLSKTYCSTQQTVTVKAATSDSAGATAEKTFSTNIWYEEDPCAYGGCGGCGGGGYNPATGLWEEATICQ